MRVKKSFPLKLILRMRNFKTVFGQKKKSLLMKQDIKYCFMAFMIKFTVNVNKIKEDKKVQNTKISSVKISSRKVVKAFKYKISVTNARGLYANELDKTSYMN